jgi:hypothetical protein
LTKVFVAVSNEAGALFVSKDKRKLLKEETIAGTIAQLVRDGDVRIKRVEMI